MRDCVRLTIVCLCITFGIPTTQGQNSKPNTSTSSSTSPAPGTVKTYPATPISGVTTPPPPMMQMPLIVPMFLEGNHFVSTLVLVNNSTATTYADVTLRGLDGSTIATKRVNFTPHSQRRVNIGDLLDTTRSSATSGSILVMQSPALTGPSIGAVLSMTYLGSDAPNYIDEEIFMPSMTGSQVLQGVADSGDGSPLLALSSLTETAQHILIQCLGKEGAGATRRLSLAAGETLITDACAGSDVHNNDLTALIERGDETSQGPQGIRLISDGMSGAFAAFALARHGKNSDHFFSSVLFTDPKTLNSPNTVFTGVPVGTAALLPDEHYVPQLTLTNFSNKDIHVHTTFARTSDDTPVAQEVGSITVPAHHTQDLTLPALRGDVTLQNSFIVHSGGAPGDLMVKFVSKGDAQSHEVELQAKDEKDMENAGGHPWTIEQNTESTLLLFNHSETQQKFTVRVSDGSANWQKEYKLAPMQTKSISIRELIEEQLKDDEGKTLPKNAKSGETSWLVADTAKGSGRLLQSDRSTGMARNFSCGYSDLLCGASVAFETTVLADGSIEEFADITAITCTSGQPQFCSGQQTGSSTSFSTAWTSQSPSVASIHGSSTTPPVSLLGVSPGTSDVEGRLSSEYCSSGGGGNATVATLTCSPVSVQRGASVTCTASNAPAGSTYSQWTFTDSGGHKVSSSHTTSSWTGTVVSNGTVAVTVTSGSSYPTQILASLNVSPRAGWTFSPQPSTQKPNGYVCNGTTLSLPSTPTNGSRVGESCPVVGANYTTQLIGGDGPNTGYSYLSGITATGQYSWIVSPDIDNSGSQFYSAQCGNYSASANPNGFINGPTLQADDHRHEGGTINSHYANYVNAISAPSNNPGTVLEGFIEFQPANFNADVSAKLTSVSNSIISAATVEPCGTSVVTYNQACAFDGYINYSPYAACH